MLSPEYSIQNTTIPLLRDIWIDPHEEYPPLLEPVWTPPVIFYQDPQDYWTVTTSQVPPLPLFWWPLRKIEGDLRPSRAIQGLQCVRARNLPCRALSLGSSSGCMMLLRNITRGSRTARQVGETSMGSRPPYGMSMKRRKRSEDTVTAIMAIDTGVERKESPTQKKL